MCDTLFEAHILSSIAIRSREGVYCSCRLKVFIKKIEVCRKFFKLSPSLKLCSDTKLTTRLKEKFYH